jgi:hypothetical protein
MNDAPGLDSSPTRQLGCWWSWYFHVGCNSLPALAGGAGVRTDSSPLLPGNEAVRRSLAYLLTGVGILAFRAGYRVHRKKFVLVLLMAGIAAVTLGSHTPAPCFPLTHGKSQSHSLAALS